MAQPAEAGRGTVRERLDRALLDCLASPPGDDLGEVTVEAVAQAAGVSRATAYRYLGSREELHYRAAITLAEAHLARCAAILARTRTVAERVEESFAYVVRETSGDERLRLLLRSARAAAIDEALRAMSAELMEPSVRAGQEDGQVRTDVPAEELIGWLVEQVYVIERLSLTEEKARLWVRRFIIPVLGPPGGSGLASQVCAILDDVGRQLKVIDRTVAAARTAVADRHT
jgi:AcrR family transcriptional regulator